MKGTQTMQNQALLHLETERKRLLAARQSQLAEFAGAVDGGRRKRQAHLFSRIRETSEFLIALDGIGGSLAAADAASRRPRYLVSSLFLYESFRKLTADRDEQFFFVTGTEVGRALVLDQWAEFEHQKRSLVGVTGDPRATHKALVRLEQFGHRLLAHFHSHPGNGPGSTQPSGIDEDFQLRLEGAGHLAVMAIFSRDGFVGS